MAECKSPPVSFGIVGNMNRIKLYIANASGYFTPSEVKIIKDGVRAAERYIAAHFTLDYDIDMIVTTPSYMMKPIPEDGVSGRTYSSRLVGVVLDKADVKISKQAVFETVCHEMSHSLRWEKLPEISEDLFDGLILEGLATALEEHAIGELGGESQFFLKTIQKMTDTEFASIISKLQASFSERAYDYETIFFTGDDSLPRWAGYGLGYYYVKKYLDATGRSIEQATLDSYAEFRRVLLGASS